MTSLTAGASLWGAGCRLSAALLLLAGCAQPDRPPAPEAEEHADEEHADEDGHHAPLEAPVDTYPQHRVVLGPGDVAAIALPAFEIHDYVTFRRLTLVPATGDVELVGAYFTEDVPGASCADDVPVSGSEALAPVADTLLDSGDATTMTLYLRPRGGSAVLDELRVSYEVRGAPGELTWRGFRVELEQRASGGCRVPPSP